MKKITIAVIMALTLIPTISSADYYATGGFKGYECEYLGTVCRLVDLDVFEKDGSYYELNTRYQNVSKYSEKERRCWINTGLGGYDVWSLAKNLLSSNSSFIRIQNDGSYEKIEPKWITFPCYRA